jgi:hypothetical protein
MALGKEVGSFSFKITSVNYDADGSTQVNVDGVAEGFGPVIGTLTFRGEAGATVGSITWRGEAFPENGAVLAGVGEGTWEALGRHQWRSRAVIRTSDGRTFGSDGLIDVPKRTYSGKNLEWS